MCPEHVWYRGGGGRGGGDGRRRRSEDGASVGPNHASDLYRPNGVMAHGHLFFLSVQRFLRANVKHFILLLLHF